MMIPLSVDTRFSLVRSQIGPMLSCSDASWMANPATPLKVFPAFCAARSISSGHVLAVHTGAVTHGIDLALGQRPHRMEVVAPCPAILVIDRDPAMPVNALIA